MGSVMLVFSFDSEDYETPAADDAERWWAETMSRCGFRASIQVVGELARALRDRGRGDVIAAMAGHDIGFHSDMHSAHPTWAEYLDRCGWEDGVAEVLRREARGIWDVEQTFGQHPSSWCKPGNSWGPQVAYAMRTMGVPVFADSPFELAPGEPLWYVNSLFLTYHIAFDRYFSVPHGERLKRMREDFLALCDRHREKYLTMYTHPCRLFTGDFTDTFRYGRNPPRSQWGPAPIRPPEEIAELQRDFEEFLRFVSGLPEVEPITYRELYELYRQPPSPWLGRDELAALAEGIGERPDYLLVGGEYISPAEAFGLVVWALARLEGGSLPEAVPVRRLLGPKESPPSEVPVGRATLEAVLAACREADRRCTEEGALPSEVRVGTEAVGPNALLQAALPILRRALQGEPPPREVPLRPVPELPAVLEHPSFKNYRFQGTWSIFPEDFEGKRVLEAVRLQSWTAKPAVVRK